MGIYLNIINGVDDPKSAKDLNAYADKAAAFAAKYRGKGSGA